MKEKTLAAQENSVHYLVASYRKMAADEEREIEAEEWSDGLIGDACADS